MNIIANKITLWILEIFFGIFTLTSSYKLYIGRKALTSVHGILLFISVIIFAIISGLLFR